MTLLVAELRAALAKVGVPDDMADAAAKAVVPQEALTDLATKADIAALKTDIAELETRLTRSMWTQTGVTLGGITALMAIARLLGLIT